MRKLPVVPTCRSTALLIFRISLDLDPKSVISSALSRLDEEGVSRSSRHVRRGCDGRGGFARRAMTSRTAKACGPGLPTLRPSCTDDVSAAMGARKPGPQGERAISVNTIAQGMPDDSADPVVTAASFFSAGGPWVRPSPGIPCALFYSESLLSCNTRALRAAGTPSRVSLRHCVRREA